MNAAIARHEIKLFPQLGTGIVEETITSTQPGRVKFHASYWPARYYGQDNQVTFLPGEPVTVVGRQGITLLVVPVSKSSVSTKN